MAGVYISYPFCAQKCTYCNFASGVFPRELESRYLEALRSEICRAQWPWIPETVYLGGGTPSRMAPEALADLLSHIPCGAANPGRSRLSSRLSGIPPETADQEWPPHADDAGPAQLGPQSRTSFSLSRPEGQAKACPTGRPFYPAPAGGRAEPRPQEAVQSWIEATIEAAPGGITFDLARAWREAGINRVSLGVQSFDPRELARTGRKHTAETIALEVGTLRAADLSNFNIDLIAGLPGQTQQSWTRSLDWIERLNPPHVSIYMLEVDEDSRLGAEVLAFGRRYGARDLPSEDAIADFYELAVERLAAMGIRRYEISNFARPGFESRHNLKYWRREPYIGFGAGAHSFDGSHRCENAETPVEYIDRIVRGLSPEVARSAAEPGEAFFLGLRLEEGVDADWSRYREGVERCRDAGLLEAEGRRLRLTPRGVLLSNEVFAEFV